MYDAAFAYVGAFKTHINVGFFNGAALPHPAVLLQGSGLRMRHVKLKPGHTIDVTALESLIVAVREHIFTRTAPLEQPPLPTSNGDPRMRSWTRSAIPIPPP